MNTATGTHYTTPAAGEGTMAHTTSTRITGTRTEINRDGGNVPDLVGYRLTGTDRYAIFQVGQQRGRIISAAEMFEAVAETIDGATIAEGAGYVRRTDVAMTRIEVNTDGGNAADLVYYRIGGETHYAVFQGHDPRMMHSADLLILIEDLMVAATGAQS